MLVFQYVNVALYHEYDMSQSTPCPLDLIPWKFCISSFGCVSNLGIQSAYQVVIRRMYGFVGVRVPSIHGWGSQVLAGNQRGFARAVQKSGVPRKESFGHKMVAVWGYKMGPYQL